MASASRFLGNAGAKPPVRPISDFSEAASLPEELGINGPRRPEKAAAAGPIAKGPEATIGASSRDGPLPRPPPRGNPLPVASFPRPRSPRGARGRGVGGST